MILQRLAALYERLREEGAVEPIGFQRKEIPFVIVLDEEGRFVDLIDTRDTDAKGRKTRGRLSIVPQEVKRTVASVPNLLWDNIEYVFGVPREDGADERLRARALARQQEFVARLERLPESIQRDPGVAAVLAYMRRGDHEAARAHRYWTDVVESNGNVSFMLDGEQGLVCERPQLREALDALAVEDNEEETHGQCLVTGAEDAIARLHPAVKGVRGAQGTGANIVSFNLPAFESYGLKQGANAAVGRRASNAYVAALNWLLAERPGEPPHRLFLGDTTYVFWAEHKHEAEDLFAGLLAGPPAPQAMPSPAPVRQVFAAPRKGLRPLLDDPTPFYVLGLAPNAARLSVRYWQEATVAEIAARILEHFDDIEIAGPGADEPMPVRRLLRALAAQGKDDNIPPLLAGALMAAILGGGEYPRTALVAAVGRCRAEQGVPRPRAALIKAWLARRARRGGTSDREVGMALDPANESVGYRLGRLFAVLEAAQRAAQGSVNATIRDRFYGAASATPVLAFPQLMKLKNHHLGALRRDKAGLAEWFERQIGEIVAGISEFPAHLPLEEQGRFAVGYYHQRHHRQPENQKETTDA